MPTPLGQKVLYEVKQMTSPYVSDLTLIRSFQPRINTTDIRIKSWSSFRHEPDLSNF